MKRHYLSGAEKRKLAAEKKAKESAAIAKHPKIDQLLSAVSSKSSDNVNPRHVSDDETQQSDCETHSSLSHGNRDQNETLEMFSDAEIDDASYHEQTSPMQASSSSSKSTQIPNDAGLWNIETDMISLQMYWIDKGKAYEMCWTENSIKVF